MEGVLGGRHGLPAWTGPSGGSVWLQVGVGEGGGCQQRLWRPDWSKYQFGIIRRHVIRRRQGARRRVSVNGPEWALAGLESGPLDPRFPPGSLEITAPHLPGGKQLHSPSVCARVTQWGPGRARGGTGALSSGALVPPFTPAPAAVGPACSLGARGQVCGLDPMKKDLHAEKGLSGS